MSNKKITLKSFFQKIISIFLSVSMLAPIVFGCVTILTTGIKSAQASYQRNSVKGILYTENSLRSMQFQDQQIYIDNTKESDIKYQWDKYVGDLEMFVYGLLVSEYQNYYEVFNGVIELPDGNFIYGIGYSDFSSYFESDDGLGFFPAGFIPLIGEPEIPYELVESGLEIVDIDQMEIGISFVLAYDITPFLKHCVIWDKYLQYGIDENGRITYTAKDYVRGKCNEELGALYSFDEKRFVFNPNIGTYQYISGQSLYTPINYADLEAEVNRILEQQDFNFSTVEIQTAVYTAQEVFTNYLLSLQEESFMGYPVTEIIAIAEQLDPMEMIRFTPEGHVIIDIADDVPDSAEGLTKWLTGIRIGITVVCFFAPMIMPALAPFAGAISMASCNIFTQILNENKDLSDIDWKSVALSAVTGALVAWAIPTMSADVAQNLVMQGINEGVSKLAGYSLQSVSSGLVHGVTDAVSELLDGQKINDVWDTFIISAAQTAAINLAFSGAFELLNPAIDTVVSNNITKLQKTITDNPNGWLAKLVDKVGELNIHQVHFENEKLDRFLRPRSVYESAKMASREVKIQTSFLDKAFDRMPNNDNFNYYNSEGQLLSKNQIDIEKMKIIIKPTENCDPEIIEYFVQRRITELPVVNGVVDFSSFSYYTFIPDDGISPDINVNFEKFYKQLANKWQINPSEIPPKIKDVLSDAEIENLTSTLVRKALKDAKITLHEGSDGAVYLLDYFIHSKISHAGGRALATLQKTISAGVDYLKWLIYGIEPAVIESVTSNGVN